MLSVWCQGFKSGLNLEEKLFQEPRNAVGTREQLLRLWLHGGDDRKRWLVSGLGQGGKKDTIKEKALILIK